MLNTRKNGFLIYELHLKPISYAPYCLDILWFGGLLFDLLTNLFDMDSDCCNIADRLHIPDFAEQLLLCNFERNELLSRSIPTSQKPLKRMGGSEPL